MHTILLSAFLAAILSSHSVLAQKYVFAHYILGNSAGFSIDDFSQDIEAAQAASIDAFALDIAPNDENNAASLSNLYTAANDLGFKAFFSFDYNSDGVWTVDEVVSLLQEYQTNGAYFQYMERPLVSTFEGGPEASDWTSIKEQTDNIFFVPEWSDQGTSVASNSVVDGAFSWDAWPTGPASMTTSNDEAYMSALGSKPYMMPVSPWFYTNLPNYSKNWLWRGDSLWYDRWNQVFELAPALVEIITWNDYGESHYIGPLHSNEDLVAQYGGAPFDYAANMPHDGWRTFLPYLIDTYKSGSASITSEAIVVWYRETPGSECNDGGTVCDDVSYQTEYTPEACAEDEVFFQALLASAGTITVSIGSYSQTFQVADEGMYFNSVAFDGNFGAVTVSISHGSTAGPSVTGPEISSTCENNGYTNWNAWVGTSSTTPV